MKTTSISVFFLFFLSLQPIAALNITSLELEKKIAHSVIQEVPKQLALLEQLVNINSGSNNIAGVTEVGKIVRHQFEQLGFKTYWVDQPTSMHRAGTLVAERLGSKGKRILLIGHLDTVFPANSAFRHFELHGKTATGPGIIDDKGGIVVILYALKALQAAHVLEDATIRVVLTGDEEDAGQPAVIARKPLIDAAQHSDVALEFEWAFTNDTATVARRGISDWLLKTEGKDMHSSQIFQKPVGYGAIFELSRILNSFRTELTKEPYLTFSPGILLGGNTVNYQAEKSEGSAFGKANVVAKVAVANGDLRFISVEQKIATEKKMTRIVGQSLVGTKASIVFKDDIPAMPMSKNNLELLDKYSEVSKSLGYGPVKPLSPGARGASDLSYVIAMVSAGLAGLGPIGDGAHSAKETLEVDSLARQTQKIAILIYRLSTSPL